jgi:hypothetical protein
MKSLADLEEEMFSAGKWDLSPASSFSGYDSEPAAELLVRATAV